MSDIFRFMAVRPAQRTREPQTATRLFSVRTQSSLHRDLAAAKAAGQRQRMIDLADRFLDGPQFVADLAVLTASIASLDLWLMDRPQASAEQVRQRVEHVFGRPVTELVQSTEFQDDRRRITDSLLAVTASARRRVPGRARMLRGARLLGLLERIAADDPLLRRGDGVASVLRSLVLLPPDVFPLPPISGDRERPRAPSPPRDPRGDIPAKVARLTSLQAAIDELNHAVEVGPAESPGAGERGAPAGRAPRRARGSAAGTAAPAGGAPKQDPFLLPVSRVAALSEQTRALLRELAVPSAPLHVPRAVTRIEREGLAVAADLFLPGRGPTTVAIGRTFMILPTLHGFTLAPGLSIGPAASLPQPAGSEPSVPAGAGSVRPAGIGDLLIVRQTLKKYEPYEVAHVENALRGESRERTHRRTETSEQIIVTEVEREETSERDLQSTERFELQREASQTISEDLRLEAGVTVTATYGAVQITAEADAAYERAREESNRTASVYARNVTERALSRLQERTFERRTRRLLQEIEETNRHAIDNAGGSAHITGVYRWIDKIYGAQLVNYGRRMLLEFIVPEPAAFYRFAQSAAPIEGMTLEKPEPPGYGTGATFVPLMPVHITPLQYLYWVGKYNAQGVEPPPPEFAVVDATIEKEYEKKAHPFTEVSTELKVPPGYAARRVSFAYWVLPKADPFYVCAVVGDRSLALSGGALGTSLEGEDAVVPVGLLTTNILAAVVAAELTCRRSDAAYRRWQLKTFGAIMEAYHQLKARYEEQLGAARVQEGVVIRGRNPQANREIERTELKRAAVSLLTAQHYDLFNAMEPGVPPYGYPQMDLAEAEAEGSYIRFFEQGLEWRNMTYVFYPYFWGRKGEWPAISQLDDPDPLFTRFLQAGAARVQVPVRPGFEEAILYFLESGGAIWNGGDPPHIEDELYVSLAQEIRDQTGAEFQQGPGTVSVVNGQAGVTGDQTTFTAADLDREIQIAGVAYRIRAVDSETAISVWEPYSGPDATDVPYALGARLVGLPWDVRMPTTLVMLQSDAVLPDWTAGG